MAVPLTVALVAVGLLGSPAQAFVGDPGDLDTGFNDTLAGALTTAGSDLSGGVLSVTWDGSGYLVAGWLGNGPGTGAGSKRVFRANADGTLDTAFNNALTTALANATGDTGLNSAVRSVAWDGSGYLIGGDFSNGPGAGAGFKRVFRANADGSLDTSFNDALTGALAAATGDTGLDLGVLSVTWDGSGYLIGGDFSNGPGAGAGAKWVFRAHADGSLDTSFNDTLTTALAAATGGTGLPGSVQSVAWDGSGYLISGHVNGPGTGAGFKPVFRANADGTLDTAFNNTLTTALATTTGGTGLNGLVESVAWDGSGYLIGGQFSNGPGAGAGLKWVFRAKADGALDTTFNDTLTTALATATGGTGLEWPVLSVAWDGSGYLIGGDFRNGPGTGAGNKRVFRAHADGSLDTAFNDTLTTALANATGDIGLGGPVFSVAWDGSGYLLGGYFALYRVLGPDSTVTFNANGGLGSMADQVSNAPAALSANAFTRAGYSFAGWNTAADGSGTAYANQATYPFDADATLYAQWTPLPPPGPGPVLSAPVVVAQPVDVTTAVGGSASFTSTATGVPVPEVRWQMSSDAGSTWVDVPGATSTTLTLTGVASDRDGTRFRAVFTNTAGTAASSAAVLTVTGGATPPPVPPGTVTVLSPATGSAISANGYFGVTASTTNVGMGAIAYLTLNGSAKAQTLVDAAGVARFEKIPAEAGDYAVRIGPAGSTVVSDTFTLTILPFGITAHAALPVPAGTPPRVEFTITTGNWSPGTVIALTRNGRATATVKVKAKGTPVTVTVPAKPGTYQVRVDSRQGWVYGDHAGIVTLT